MEWDTISQSLRQQWTHPLQIFPLLLLVGGDIVARALVELAGTPIVGGDIVARALGLAGTHEKLTALTFPSIPFSFGWIAYIFQTLKSVLSDDRFISPSQDPAYLVVDGGNGYIRDNASWVIARLMKTYPSWMDKDVTLKLVDLLDQRWLSLEDQAFKSRAFRAQKPRQAGLCVSIYEPDFTLPAGIPCPDKAFYMGYLVIVLQLGIAAIPLGVNGDWSVMLVTGAGTLLAYVTALFPQWAEEKWACRRRTNRTFILTQGNGSQHAVVILGNGNGLNFGDLARGPLDNGILSESTKICFLALTVFWVALLITASAASDHQWYLVAIGALGTLYQLAITSMTRRPSALGIHLRFKGVIGQPKVMATLFELEEKYPRLGRSLLPIFFPGEIRPEENARWQALQHSSERLSSDREREKAAKHDELNRLANSQQGTPAEPPLEVHINAPGVNYTGISVYPP